MALLGQWQGGTCRGHCEAVCVRWQVPSKWLSHLPIGRGAQGNPHTLEPECCVEPQRIFAMVTEIRGDREHMGGLTPRPGALRHFAALASADISGSPLGHGGVAGGSQGPLPTW